MQLLTITCPTLAVSAVYCLWQRYLRVQFERERGVRDRVTYMLWVAADCMP